MMKISASFHDAGEEASPEPAVSNKADAKLLAYIENIVRFDITNPYRIFILQSCHGLHGMRAAHCLRSSLGHSDALYFPSLDKLSHSSRSILDWHVGIGKMLIE